MAHTGFARGHTMNRTKLKPTSEIGLLAAMVRDRRLALGMTRNQLFLATGICEERIFRLETGFNKTPPLVKTIVRLGDALDLSIEGLCRAALVRGK
jgi:transcriptional regulator with XRE-family HTH domain